MIALIGFILWHAPRKFHHSIVCSVLLHDVMLNNENQGYNTMKTESLQVAHEIKSWKSPTLPVPISE